MSTELPLRKLWTTHGSSIVTIYYPWNNDKSKHNSTWDQVNGSGWHDRQVLPWLSTWGIRNHPVNVDNSNFRNPINNTSNHPTQRRQRKKWTRKDKKHVLYCYLKSKPTQRRYRKRMIEIWTETVWFDATSKWLADQDRIIRTKGWFSDQRYWKYTKKWIGKYII